MIDLEKYLYKNVKIVNSSGIEYNGFVEMFSSADDSGDKEDSIGIMINKTNKGGIGLYASEIKSIEIDE